MIFENFENYNKPKVRKVNKYVSIAIYTSKSNPKIIGISNTKGENNNIIYLYPETLEKILKKTVDLV